MSANIRKLADGFFVAPQITAADLRAAAALGVTLVVNNRPDGEEPGQPASAEIEAAAKAAGLAYAAIPIRAVDQIALSDLDALDAALANNEGAALAFCRSGARSTVLRAYARARAGDPAEAIIAEAAAAGYDLAPLAARLRALVAR